MAPILAIKSVKNVFGVPPKSNFAAIPNLPLGLSEGVYGETGQSFWAGADTAANVGGVRFAAKSYGRTYALFAGFS